MQGSQGEVGFVSQVRHMYASPPMENVSLPTLRARQEKIRERCFLMKVLNSKYSFQAF